MNEDLIKRLRKLAVATLSDGCDQIAGKRGFLDHDIRARVNGRKIVGIAATVLQCLATSRTNQSLPLT